MVLEVKPKTEMFKVQNIPGFPEHVYFTDFLGSRDDKVPNPITSSWFRIEQGPPATPPTYEYDEVGVVVEGIVNQADLKSPPWDDTLTDGMLQGPLLWRMSTEPKRQPKLGTSL
ncbi:hypothetical protein A1O7_03569 [Cladophialophora yegresii CBS 114405]|uniref:Uncharacterized protein n=1 Tax=Cladophialophora yegresii CBS 114405 TaxID=1182544 RepID=W9WXY0_9EURO|nr:uncharacterized protein A1O7_03569 [Cladophialophora yegresii CBS 114405]EXJ63124.1 hypothetical protein A1O7_03569 [Cladophialophora yegresii CBS 114405]